MKTYKRNGWTIQPYANWHGSYLSVKGRTEWKTKRAAMSHVLGIRKIIAKRGHFMGNIICDLETV